MCSSERAEGVAASVGPVSLETMQEGGEGVGGSRRGGQAIVSLETMQEKVDRAWAVQEGGEGMGGSRRGGQAIVSLETMQERAERAWAGQGEGARHSFHWKRSRTGRRGRGWITFGWRGRGQVKERGPGIRFIGNEAGQGGEGVDGSRLGGEGVGGSRRGGQAFVSLETKQDRAERAWMDHVWVERAWAGQGEGARHSFRWKRSRRGRRGRVCVVTSRSLCDAC
jgi:hypothetical protein